jgi:hypothetical protein
MAIPPTHPYRGQHQTPGGRDSIAIPAALHAPILRLHWDSPLTYYTTVGYNGGPIIMLDRPAAQLSDGERELWDLLRTLIAGSLLSRTDVTAALGAFFAALSEEVAA